MSEKKPTSSSFWVKLLRIAAYVTIVCGCLISLIFGCIMIFFADESHRAVGILVGLIIIVAGSVMSLLGSAGIMVYLDMASDLRVVRSRLEKGERNER